MEVTLIVDDPELAQVLSGTHLPTSEGWVGLAARGGRQICCGMTSTENRARVARVVAQSFMHYATAADSDG